MLKILSASLLAATLVTGAASSASAFERSVTVTTPRGTYTGNFDRSCAAGVCTGSGQITGPNGYTVDTSGACLRTFPYHWVCRGTLTGPNGVSITRRARVSFY
ncbi:MAG TPA: hypothetical protein VHA07_02875 [Devosia sp.]|nr:hypothetical protein [Devosia sp.]